MFCSHIITHNNTYNDKYLEIDFHNHLVSPRGGNGKVNERIDEKVSWQRNSRIFLSAIGHRNLL